MKTHARLLFVLPFLAALITAPALAQTGAPPTPEPTETIDHYVERLVAGAPLPDAAEEAKELESATAKRVAAKTTSTALPEGFAGRVNDAISDFLPFFQFAVDTVSTSEDKGSVTVKFNPFELGAYGPVALAATATEPKVFEPFSKEIIDAARETQVKALLAGIDDFSDVTWNAEYGFTRPARSWLSDRKLFGRQTATYKSLIKELLEAALVEVAGEQEAEGRAFAAMAAERRELFSVTNRADVGGITFAELRALIAQGKLSFTEGDLLRKLAVAADRAKQVEDRLTALNVANLPALIDNQPQLVLKASYHDPKRVVGPRATAFTLSYEMGTNNLNAALREYRALREEARGNSSASDPAVPRGGTQDLRLKAFSAVTDQATASEDRFVFSLTYKDTGAYTFTHDYADEDVMRTATLSQPGSTEWIGRFTWTRFLRSKKALSPELPEAVTTADLGSEEKPKEEKPRMSFTLEHCQASGNPKLQDRTVGRLTLTLPMAGNATLPISITYANRAELLGDPDKTFGAHVGISYKLNRNGGD